MKKKRVWLILGLIVFQTTASFAEAGSPELILAMESMKSQMREMQELIKAQNDRIAQLEHSVRIEAPKAPAEMPQISAAPMSDADFQKSLKDNINEVIPWLKGAKFGGDFRLRHEYFDFFDFKNDAGTTQDRSRNRFRIRLRWGFDKDYGDDWKFGFRLATGSTTDQTSTNQTLGNSGYFNFKSFNIEKAMVSYTPNGLKDYGPVKGVKIAGGKTDNPFLRYSTPIVWDSDVTPEGLYEQATLELLSTEEEKVKFFGTLGQFIINENSGSESDAQLYGYQGALNWSTYRFNSNLPTDLTMAVSFYDYPNWSQSVLAANNSASTSYLRTNSIAADNFGVLDLYPELQFYIDRTPVTLWANYVENVRNVGTDDFRRTLGNDIHDQNDAWGAGFKAGRIKNKGDIEGFYGYYEIGANAVVAAFNDSDFGGPGGAGHTNRKGHKFGLSYGLNKDVTVNYTAYLVQTLNPFNGNATLGIQNSTNEHVFRSQFDLVYKF